MSLCGWRCNFEWSDGIDTRPAAIDIHLEQTCTEELIAQILREALPRTLIFRVTILLQAPLGVCCRGVNSAFGTIETQRFTPAGNLCTTEGTCTTRNKTEFDATYSAFRARNYRLTHTWHLHKAASGEIVCPKASACCTIRIRRTGQKEPVCVHATPAGCSWGSLYADRDSFLYDESGIYLGRSTECPCSPLSSEPRHPDDYFRCVGVSDTQTGRGVADAACENTGACCFTECCARLTEDVCVNAGGVYYDAVHCVNSPCATLECRNALFEIAIDEDGYVILQSDAEIELSTKKHWNGIPTDEVPEEPNPNFTPSDPMCGHYTGDVVLDRDDKYLVMQTCNSHVPFSPFSIEADMIVDRFGYNQFGSGYKLSEDSCLGFGT